MHFYYDIVYKALNQEIAPFLRDIMEPALIATYSNGWYHSYGLNILKNYKNFKDIEEGMQSGMQPLKAMDITALCFFLNPYDDDGKFGGAMQVLVDYYQWDPWQIHCIDRIRIIRNLVSHEKYEKDFEKTDENIFNGVQEKKWLNELEDIIKRVKTSFNLTEYYVLLEQAVEKKLNEEGHKTRRSFFMSNGEMARNSYTKIYKFSCSEAPIDEPLTGEAPWTKINVDLEELPWPSTVLEQQKDANKNVNTWTEKTQSNYKDNMTVVDEKIQETMNKAMDQLDKGMNKLFNMFGKNK